MSCLISLVVHGAERLVDLLAHHLGDKAAAAGHATGQGDMPGKECCRGQEGQSQIHLDCLSRAVTSAELQTCSHVALLYHLPDLFLYDRHDLNAARYAILTTS